MKRFFIHRAVPATKQLFYTSLFVREYGTNNLPDCSNMCHESSGVALAESLGIGKGSVKLEDLYEAEVIMISRTKSRHQSSRGC